MKTALEIAGQLAVGAAEAGDAARAEVARCVKAQLDLKARATPEEWLESKRQLHAAAKLHDNAVRAVIVLHALQKALRESERDGFSTSAIVEKMIR